MESSNKQQTEDNFKDMIGDEAIEKIKLLAGKGGSCFFCTNIKIGKSFSTRPMAPELIDDNGSFWFLSANDSYKNKELHEDSTAQLLFQGSEYSDFMTLYGNVNISTNKNKIDELWKPIMKTWFTEGKDDSRITVLEFVPSEGYYWDTKNNMLVGMDKRAYGAIVGETYDDSIEGTIRP